VGEGQGGGCAADAGLSSLADHLNNPRQISKHVIIREAKHEIALRSEPSVALTIMALPGIEIVRLPVKLNDQPG
jgi:hypothetical protein